MFISTFRITCVFGIIAQVVFANPNSAPLAESALGVANTKSLEKRDADVCGYMNSDYEQPYWCPSGQLCIRNELYDIFGCCSNVQQCMPLVGCVPYGGVCDITCQTNNFLLCGYAQPYCVRALAWQADVSKWYTGYNCAPTSNDFKIYPTATNAPTSAPVASITAVTTSMTVLSQVETFINNPAPSTTANIGSNNVNSNNNGGDGDGNINGNSGVIMFGNNSGPRSIMRVDTCLVLVVFMAIGWSISVW